MLGPLVKCTRLELSTFGKSNAPGEFLNVTLVSEGDRVFEVDIVFLSSICPSFIKVLPSVVVKLYKCSVKKRTSRRRRSYGYSEE